ncbi:ENTH domain-containing protein C19F8.03c [Leucoagaricus sp. SymC.cos]|nr:ENTH domain-containing protein C19F8.03c [Leucoagaricus sp. SymC.cos]
MSSFDKTVKLACKPKNAPPKSKYIDSIIAATWSEDGAVHDVCKALAPRFREPNSIVVFKALIVLHTMIRNGATENVLSHLSQGDVLRLRNVYGGNWEGFENPDHLHHYARYLDCRIRSFANLKHDVIRVQSESNRDIRNSTTLEDEEMNYSGKKRGGGGQASATLGRSKTMMGRKLRSMTVEKGLLRETKIVHQMIDSVVECRFYLDGVDDELRLTAFRMLVKDLLILFQAGNEAVINLLEQYFEMSHLDATEALSIYRHFCKQTEHVTEYLGVAKKLQNLLNVPIPNLRHAPLSLITALQEYLDDPNFEQNRLEHRASRTAANGKVTPKLTTDNSKTASYLKPTTNASATNPVPSPTSAPASSQQAPKLVNMDNFFNSIEENQTTMFNAQSASSNATPNPFAQMMAGQQFVIPQTAAQPTGFMMPQHTAMPNAANPFSTVGQQSSVPGQRPFTTFLTTPDQQNFLQPQATGVNPFRQSMLVPQTTGMALFGVGGGQNQVQPMATGFGQSLFNSTSSPPQPLQQVQQPFQLFSASASGVPSNSAFSATQTQTSINVPQRPASTPLTSLGLNARSTSPPPLKPHMTGTKNPFGPVITPVPPVPKPPTMAELALMGHGVNSAPGGSTQQQQSSNQANGGSSTNTNTTSGFNFSTSALNPGGTDMGSVASSFAFSNSKPAATSPTGTSTGTGSTFSDSLFGGSLSGLSTQPTSAGSTNSTAIALTSSLPTGVGNGTSGAPGALKPQMTGFAGLKAFKPTSSFGAALMESLPPVPSSSSATSPTSGATGASTIGPGSGGFGALNAGTLPSSTNPSGSMGRATSPTGTASRLGVGLRPQLTGGGAVNPFRASMAAGNSFGGFGGAGVPSVPPLPTGFGSGSMFGSTPFSSSTSFQNGFGQPQQPRAGQPQGQQ